MNSVELTKTIIAFGAVAAASWRAWSTRGPASEPPRLLVRLIVTTAMLAIPLSVLIAIGEVDNGWGHVAVMACAAPILMAPILALLILVIELIVWRLHPIRSRKWLAGAVFLFMMVILIIPAFGMAAFQDVDRADGAGADETRVTVVRTSSAESREESDREVPLVFAILCAGAIAWWSHLPPRRRPPEDVFA